MKKSLMLLFGFWMRLSMAHSAPFSSEEARRVFDESSVNVSTSAKVVGDYLFTEVSWKEDKSGATEDREAKELSALLAAMQNFIAPNVALCTNSPFCKTLTDWLEPMPEFNVPNVQSFVLKDETKGDQRHQVVALEAKPLLDAKRKAQADIADKNHRTESQWAELLQGAYAQFKTPEEKRKFFALLECPIVNLIADKGSGDYGTALPGGKSGLAELEKINRIIDRELPDCIRETLLVLDSTTGQNAVIQAQEFGNAAALTGIVLTKLDGTAKGGIIISIRRTLGIPVKFIGVGEKVDDLQKFEPQEFVRALFGE